MSEQAGPTYWSAYEPVFRPLGLDPAFSVGRYRARGEELTPVVMLICAAAACLFVINGITQRFVDPSGLFSTGIVSFMCLTLWRRSRCRVETDPFGITVVNMRRTRRLRWSDIDAVTFDGRISVTLLLANGVLRCDALRWDKPVPGKHLRPAKTGHREPLDSAAAWLEATRAYYSVRV